MTQVPHGEVDQIVNIGLRDVVSVGAVLEVHVFMATVDMFASACSYGMAPRSAPAGGHQSFRAL